MQIQQLFEQFREIFPDTTTRQFSGYCGMSEGYYGSLVAQNLAISTNALIILAEVLQHKLDLECREQPEKMREIEALQQSIAAEVATRSTPQSTGSPQVNRMLLKALAKLCYERDMPAMPFSVVVGWR